ncbi:MAG: hypothetical protein KC492_08270, partial [Myxococcales bacterium]|nr:hypothetical protein [Myxococcales bacterium]
VAAASSKVAMYKYDYTGSLASANVGDFLAPPPSAAAEAAQAALNSFINKPEFAVEVARTMEYDGKPVSGSMAAAAAASLATPAPTSASASASAAVGGAQQQQQPGVADEEMPPRFSQRDLRPYIRLDPRVEHEFDWLEQ